MFPQKEIGLKEEIHRIVEFNVKVDNIISSNPAGPFKKTNVQSIININSSLVSIRKNMKKG